MSVQNGQNVSAQVTNAAFVSKTTDSTSTGKLTLNKASEGTQVESVQKAVNKIYEGLGTTGQDDTTINNYANNNYILDGDSRKVAIEKLDVQAAAQQAEVTAIDNRVTDLEQNDMTIAGNKTFSDNVVINGNLTVNGTTTRVNSTVLEVTDPNIIINNNGNDTSAEGSGLTVERTGTHGSIVYQNSLASKFKAGDLGSEQELVTTGHTQTLTNKTLTAPSLTNYQTNTEITTPATPSAGTRRLYAKSDGFYEIDSAGIESKFQTGAGSGANTTLSNLTAPTNINQTLRPNANNARDIGEPNRAFRRTHTQFIYDSTGQIAQFIDARDFRDVDGQVAVDMSGSQNIAILPSGTAGVVRRLQFFPISGVGNVSLYIPNNVGSAVNFVLPNTNGTAGQYLRNNGSGATSWVSPVFVWAVNSSAQSIPNATPTQIGNWTENIDNFSAFDPATGTFTVPANEAGVYFINLKLAVQDTVFAGDRVIGINRNGVSQSLAFRSFENRGSNLVSQDTQLLISLSVGDTITSFVQQSAGANQSLTSNNAYNQIIIQKVGV